MEAALFFPNAIFFVFDLANKKVQVPEYINGVLTAANESCVSIGTQAEVDGEVTVKLSDKFSESEKDSCEVVFNGFIVTPGKKIAIVTSELDKVLEMDVRDRKTHVKIWVDDLNYPSVVLVEAA